VTHWEIPSASAVQLATGMIEAHARAGGGDWAAALRDVDPEDDRRGSGRVRASRQLGRAHGRRRERRGVNKRGNRHVLTAYCDFWDAKTGALLRADCSAGRRGRRRGGRATPAGSVRERCQGHGQRAPQPRLRRRPGSPSYLGRLTPDGADAEFHKPRNETVHAEAARRTVTGRARPAGARELSPCRDFPSSNQP
jgi:hypothetical protein